MTRIILQLLIVCFFAGQGDLFAQADPLIPKKAETNPVIDGLLDDQAWKNSIVADGFTSYWPVFGKPYPFNTKVYMVYTEEDMYFAFRCEDDEPEKIKSTMSARDKIRREDWVAVILDPFNDQQSFIAFYVNALGVQMDSKGLSGGEEDESADFVFYSAGSITEDGYNVELRIPFKTLRYKRGDVVDMGIMFERRIQRYTVSGTSPALDPQKGLNFFTQLRPMQLTEIKHYTLMEAIPSFTYSRQSHQDEGSMSLYKSKPELGFTGKLGVTSQLVLDVTYNPDFSQVESDAGQIEENQRYALFYPEKRPFFQEGSETFKIAAINEHGSFQGALHTRQIVNPLAGAKLSGKIGPKTRMALLYSLDEQPEFADSANRFTNHAVGRLVQALNKDSYLGLITTSRFNPYSTDNHVAGLDGRFRLKNEAAVEYHLLGSTTGTNNENSKGSSFALAYLQNNDDRNLRMEIQRIGTGFQTYAGYLQRNGIIGTSLSFTPHLFSLNGFITRISPMSFAVARQDIRSSLWELELGLGARIVGEKSLSVAIFANPSNEVFMDQSFGTKSVHLMGSFQPNPELYLSASYRYGQLVRYVVNPFGGTGNTASFSFGYQPVNQFNSSLDINYADFYRSSDGGKEFNYLVARWKNTYQLNKFLFFRVIGEYNSYRKDLNADFLISFTYIPGTVIHLGYGSFFEKKEWTGYEYQPGAEFLEMKRGIFFKASYLFRK